MSSSSTCLYFNVSSFYYYFSIWFHFKSIQSYSEDSFSFHTTTASMFQSVSFGVFEMRTATMQDQFDVSTSKTQKDLK